MQDVEQRLQPRNQPFSAQPVLQERHIGHQQAGDARRTRIDRSIAARLPRQLQDLGKLFAGGLVDAIAGGDDGFAEDSRDRVGIARLRIACEPREVAGAADDPRRCRAVAVHLHHVQVPQRLDSLHKRLRRGIRQFPRVADGDRAGAIGLFQPTLGVLDRGAALVFSLADLALDCGVVSVRIGAANPNVAALGARGGARLLRRCGDAPSGRQRFGKRSVECVFLYRHFG